MEREFKERMNLFIQFQLVSPQTDVCIIVLPYCKKGKITRCFLECFNRNCTQNCVDEQNLNEISDAIYI